MKMKGFLRKVLVVGIVALFLGAIGSAFFKVNMLAYAAGTIYIRANGLVEGTDKITNDNNVTYTFTDDINDTIVVERSDIIIDGDECTLNGTWSLTYGFNLTSVSNVTIMNANIVKFGYAMWLEGASQCVISNNTCTDNEGGIWLVSSTENTVSGNNIGGSVEAVALDSSSGNNITGNNITDSYDYGVYVRNNSADNTISGNNITATVSGAGIYLSGSQNNVISGNNIKDSPSEHICLAYSSNSNSIFGNNLTNSKADVGIYVYGCSLNSFFGNNITANADTGIRIDSSSDSTISENNISENLNGIYLWYSSNITISKNDITANNESGIVIDGSNNNIVSGNNIMTNKGYGVDFNSASNKFFHNNFINNTVQVNALALGNVWDDGYPSGGNYWSDYGGTDQYEGIGQDIPGNDTIGDTPYEINADNVDRYPLMTQYEPLRPLFLESEGRWNMGEATDIEVWSVFASDVDNDGVVEIMTCAQVNQSGELRIYSYNGLAITLEHSELWQTDGDTRAWSVFALDVDGDGVTEILVGAEAKGQVFGQLRILNWNGTTLTLEHSEEWQTVSWTHVYSVFAADIDDDGVTEIITGGDAFNGTLYNNQLRIWNWNGTTLTLESSREWSTGGGAGIQSVYALDVDSDSTVEIVTAGQDNFVAQLRIWNWNGTILTMEHSEEWTLGGWMARALSVFASDIDNDGTVEIVTGGEAVVSESNSQLRVWNWNGSSLALETNIDWPLNGTYAYAWTICAGDVDRDGLAEVMTEGMSESGAQLRVWSFNGSTFRLDANQESADEYADTVFACDADGDGTIEIMTAGVSYDGMYVYEQVRIWSFPESIPPTITIVSPENKAYSTNTIPLTFTVYEPTPWISYSLNDQANETISGNITLPALLDGVHHVVVYANDTYGNMGSATVYFIVDTTKPNITNVVQDPLTNILPDTVVKINATVTDATSGVKQVLLNCTFTSSTDTWSTVFSMTHLAGYIWNATIPPQPYGTNVTYVIIAEDNAGNIITTEQIYGYKYEYPVVPEFQLPTVLVALVIATSLIAVISKKKKAFSS